MADTLTQEISLKADEIIELKNPIQKSDGFLSYRKRDEYLVDSATFVVAFFNGDYHTGTGMTVKYAEKDGIVVYKIPI